ncbi:MAG: anhydro-N-acetylmuramic acid kinase [Flavobacteriaceae bacterium]|nr:anhydro-N-acetylmuramic acid kinase [Flavobacteriaceae bacterium]
MNDDFFYAIGLMSGTSLDGLDIVYVKFQKSDYANFEILLAETISYSDIWKESLQSAINLDKKGISFLHNEYGVFLGIKTKEFISKNTIHKVDFIASHGHTVFHQPENGFTLQVGDGEEILKATNCMVVADFRTQDVQLGGQGAPLVPIGDRLLFSGYQACVNLGGFANISYERNDLRIAFDICPVNIVMNYYSNKMGLEYDDKGALASKGTIHQGLLKELNSLPFYSKKPPKSLGLEWVQQYVFPLVDKYKLDSHNILRTFLEHVAQQISQIIQPFDTILFTGGGVYNDFLIKRIEDIGKNNIIIPADHIINYKEALIFALLGLLKLQGQVNCLSSVTGAQKNHSSGTIFTLNNSD